MSKALRVRPGERYRTALDFCTACCSLIQFVGVASPHAQCSKLAWKRETSAKVKFSPVKFPRSYSKLPRTSTVWRRVIQTFRQLSLVTLSIFALQRLSSNYLDKKVQVHITECSLHLRRGRYWFPKGTEYFLPLKRVCAVIAAASHVEEERNS